MGRVPEPESGVTEVFEAAVECFGGAVAGAGPVEEREDVGGAAFQGVAEPDQFGQLGGDAGGDRLDHAGHEVATESTVGAAVGLDEALVDASRGFDLDMVIIGEQVFESGGLFVGEQVSPGE